MQKIDIPTMKNLIKQACIKLDEPLFFRGQFGGGKTEGAEQAVLELDEPEAMAALLGPDTPYIGCVQCDIRLGQYDSVDMRGFPGVDRATGLTVWHAPSTMPFIGNDAWPDNKIILLTLDEITSATAPVFANAYQVINERRQGEHIIKRNVRICAMGNRDIDKGVVNRIPMPLNNRMTHFETIISVEAWCEWAQTQGVPAVFLAFMNFRKPLLNTYDPEKYEPIIATPRTWMKAVKYFLSDMNLELKQASIQGAIGEGPMMELYGFIDVWQKVIPIKTILADPEGVRLPDEPSMQYATTVSVSGALSIKTVTPLYKFLVRLPPEFVILAMHLASKRDQKIYGTKEFVDFAKRYRQVFQAT